MDNFGYWPVTLAAALCFLTLLKWRLSLSAQRFRLEMKQHANVLLARNDIGEEIRGHINFMVWTAFGYRWFLLLVMLMVPIFGIVAIFSPRTILEFSHRDQIRDLEAKEHYREMRRLYNKVAFANHPVLEPLAILWVGLIFGGAIIISAIVRLRLPDVGPESASRTLAVVEARYWSKRGHIFAHP